MKEQDITDELISREETSGYSFEEENSIEEDIEILEGIVEYSTERNTINQLIQAVKQLNKKVKELENRK